MYFSDARLRHVGGMRERKERGKRERGGGEGGREKRKKREEGDLHMFMNN